MIQTFRVGEAIGITIICLFGTFAIFQLETWRIPTERIYGSGPRGP